MFRPLFILSTVLLLSACAEGVKDAKQILEDSLAIPKELEFRSMKTYAGGVVCGEYSAYISHHLPKADFQPFITVRGKLYKSPEDHEWQFFCGENPAQVLLERSGVGPYDANNTELGKITADLSAMATALEAYYKNHFFYPRMAEGLDALVTAPQKLRMQHQYPEGGYLKSIPVDPWGRPYLYQEEQWGRTKGNFTISTLGADGVAGGDGKNTDVSTGLLQYLRHIAVILKQQ